MIQQGASFKHISTLKYMNLIWKLISTLKKLNVLKTLDTKLNLRLESFILLKQKKA